MGLTLVRHLAIGAALWWLLTGGAPDTWLVGAPTVAAAAWLARRPRSVPESRWSWLGFARFVPFFFWESLRGGLDVTRRILNPRVPIQPGWLDYVSSLADSRARRFFVNCLSLLPGTLAADLEGARITVHLLDRTQDPRPDLQRLERQVARLFPASRRAAEPIVTA
jgi:multicomponent Na+:H+ antiporter subunit E